MKSMDKTNQESTQKPEIALKLENVNKIYKLSNKETFQALYDVNAQFFKGELVSIVGESGSGKSTLMNLIGGLDSDFSGDIISGGQNLGKLTDKQLDLYRKNHVGFVFQSFNLISHLSILDNVTLSLTLSNVSEKEKVERATEMLERVGLASHLKKKPTQLSGGQKQRVAIARALINDPEIIIADEPTGALDSQTSMQILQILKEIADSGKLVIMVTHSEKVASISSRVVEISDGRIVGDKKNENYKKGRKKKKEKQQQPPEDDKKHKSFRAYKNKQTLSLRSAIRLSFHNMWASKTKNFLMAFGVAIGIGSLILMLCFSSGITDFISNTMLSYSDPTIVTISKSAQTKTSTGPSFGSFGYSGFTDEDIDNLLNGYTEEIEDEDGEPVMFEHPGLNNYLKQLHQEKKLDVEFQVSKEDMKPGLQLLTMFGAMLGTTGARVVYDTQAENHQTSLAIEDYTNDKKLKKEGYTFADIMYVYTIPPYYTDANVMEGEMSTNKGGVMFSKGIRDLLPDESLKNEDGSPREVSLYLNTTLLDKNASPIAFDKEEFDLEVTGIMDTSVMSDLLVMYVDYDFFQEIYGQVAEKQGLNSTLAPNVYYVKTKTDDISKNQAEKITDAINDYLATYEVGKFTGSVEEQLAGMFNSMTSVIGTSLVVISCISLLVSAMMILVVLYMSVTERTKEIGVLKSIGARRKDIRRIFTSESFLIGLLSGIVGILFNFILTLVVYVLLTSTIGMAPISYRWYYFVIAIGVSVFIAMMSGLYPASKAAKLDPVESLRRE